MKLRNTAYINCSKASIIDIVCDLNRLLNTVRGHMMPPPLHVCNGLAALRWVHVGTSGHSENVIASVAHILQGHKNKTVA